MSDTAEKYADRLDPFHVLAMDTVMSSHAMMTMFKAHLQKLVESERHMHSAGHIFDPTFYRDMIHSKKFERQMKVVNAALKFLADVDAVLEEEKKALS